MKHKNIDKVLRQVAEREGISVDEVRNEIEKMINITLNDLEPSKKDIWDKLLVEGNPPTVNDFISKLTDIAEKECF